MADTKLAPLSTQVPIVDPKTGNPTPYFQQLLQILIDEKNVIDDTGEANLTDIQDLADTVSNLELDDLSDVDITANAQGDILYRAAGSEWKNLAPGTSGQFLKTNGAAANPSWGTVAAASHRGALVNKASEQSGANYTTATAMTWDTEQYDTDGFHDNVTNNTRLTIPSGVTKVRLTGNVALNSITSGVRVYLMIYKNNAEAWIGAGKAASSTSATTTFLSCSSAVVNVVAGDFFTLLLGVQTDTTVDVRTDTSFCIEVME